MLLHYQRSRMANGFKTPSIHFNFYWYFSVVFWIFFNYNYGYCSTDLVARRIDAYERNIIGHTDSFSKEAQIYCALW